jgi:predicted N-acetyltransferase YhbS
MKIREIKKADFEECADIIFTEFNKQGEGFTKETALGRVISSYIPGLTLCAEEKGKIIGLIMANKFTYAKGEYFWVDELVVKESFQGKGFGKKLMQTLE